MTCPDDGGRLRAAWAALGAWLRRPKALEHRDPVWLICCTCSHVWDASLELGGACPSCGDRHTSFTRGAVFGPRRP